MGPLLPGRRLRARGIKGSGPGPLRFLISLIPLIRQGPPPLPLTTPAAYDGTLYGSNAEPLLRSLQRGRLDALPACLGLHVNGRPWPIGERFAQKRCGLLDG